LIDAAAELLANAKRPAMVIDDGARFNIGEKAAAVAALSDYLKIPVGVAGPACRGLFGDEYENPHLKTNVMGGADVVLTLGCRFDFRLGMGNMIPQDACARISASSGAQGLWPASCWKRLNTSGLNLRTSPGSVLPTKAA
jgi:thiamine pyrophosphate-dependent acetolactate synthase large subunit-like protein